jgi:hypothetical protein
MDRFGSDLAVSLHRFQSDCNANSQRFHSAFAAIPHQYCSPVNSKRSRSVLEASAAFSQRSQSDCKTIAQCLCSDFEFVYAVIPETSLSNRAMRAVILKLLRSSRVEISKR